MATLDVIPKYILVIGYSSSNILYNDYKKEYPSCHIMPRYILVLGYLSANIFAHLPTQIHTSVRGRLLPIFYIMITEKPTLSIHHRELVYPRLSIRPAIRLFFAIIEKN